MLQTVPSKELHCFSLGLVQDEASFHRFPQPAAYLLGAPLPESPDEASTMAVMGLPASARSQSGADTEMFAEQYAELPAYIDPRMETISASMEPEQGQDGSSPTDIWFNPSLLSPELFGGDAALFPTVAGAEANNVSDARLLEPVNPETAIVPTQPSSSTVLKPSHQPSAALAAGGSKGTARPTTPRPKKRRIRQTQQSLTALQEAQAREDARRIQCLERNRIAASKCRQKKKHWVHELETAKAELESQNAALQIECHNLLEEASQMKSLLMAHAWCSDPNIESWVGKEAYRLMQKQPDFNQRHSSTGSLASAQSRHGSFGHLSTTQTEETRVLPPLPKLKPMNYNYMPDEMFLDPGLYLL